MAAVRLSEDVIEGHFLGCNVINAITSDTAQGEEPLGYLIY